MLRTFVERPEGNSDFFRLKVRFELILSSVGEEVQRERRRTWERAGNEMAEKAHEPSYRTSQGLWRLCAN